MVPGSPRSGPCAESREGPNPVVELPTGSRPANATAEENEDNLVKSIVYRYLGPGTSSTPQQVGDNIDSEDYMSITGLSSAMPMKKRVKEKESLSDVDGLPVRSRKVLRSRILGSDSEDNVDDGVTLSDSPKDMAVKIKGKKTRKQRLDKLEKLDDSIESTRVIFTDCPSHLAYEDLQSKDVDEIMAVSEGWLNDMEMARFRSKKINGKFSGVLKDRIVCLRSIIKALTERIKDTGDVTYLRRRNDELASQLRESRKEESKLQAFIREADNKIEKLNAEISDLKQIISLKPTNTEVEKTPPLPPARGRLRYSEKQELDNKEGNSEEERQH